MHSSHSVMQAEQPFANLYKPSHDERARQSFVGAMKGHLNGPVEGQLAQRYERVLLPELQRRFLALDPKNQPRPLGAEPGS